MFDVTLNGVHTVVSYLDIFDKVGRAVAHDEYIPFKVKKGKILVNNEESDVHGKKVRVEFIKGNNDNPKVNAIYVMKGSIDGNQLQNGMQSISKYTYCLFRCAKTASNVRRC